MNQGLPHLQEASGIDGDYTMLSAREIITKPVEDLKRSVHLKKEENAERQQRGHPQQQSRPQACRRPAVNTQSTNKSMIGWHTLIHSSSAGPLV